MPAKRAVAPFRANTATPSYCSTTASAACVACSVASFASVASCAAVCAACAFASALPAAVLALPAAPSAAAFAASACAAASVAGLPSRLTGALTSSVPRSAGRVFTPSRLDTSSSSVTPWLSLLMAFSTSCLISCFSCSVIVNPPYCSGSIAREVRR